MPSSISAAAYDNFNSQYRKKTLVEEHLERLAKGGGTTSAAGSKTQKPIEPTAPIDRQKGNDASSGGSDSSDSGSSDDDSDRSDGQKDRKKRGKSESKKRKRDKKVEKKSSKSKKEKTSKKYKKSREKDVGTKPAPAPSKPTWEGDHPWRPFDRDKDLELKPKAVNPDALKNLAAASTAGRFQSAGGTRHFL